jgi:RimJ/RimL family protein N-acetyltransferase
MAGVLLVQLQESTLPPVNSNRSAWRSGAQLSPPIETECLTLAAVEQESDRLAGTLTFFLRSGEHQHGEIGFMFHPEFQGRGLAAGGARVVLRLGFGVVRLPRIFGHCDGHNLPSARLMERLGMRQEAKLIQNEWVKGEWTADWIYPILDEEWRQALRTRP